MVLDPLHLLKENEKAEALALLKSYNYNPENFVISVEEDQSPLDMNDLEYDIFITVKAHHHLTHKEKSYPGAQGSGTWLKPFEEDLKSGFFMEPVL